MLGYLVRTLPVVLRAGLANRRIDPSAGPLVTRLTRRVRLGEVDVNRHMNQAVFPQVMELGRIDFFLRSGAWTRWRAAGLTPLVAEQRIVYRRELKPFARYTVDTRATAVEGRLVTLSHHIVGGTGAVGATVHAVGDVKLLFLGSGGVLDASEAAALCEGLLHAPLAVADWRVASV